MINLLHHILLFLIFGRGLFQLANIPTAYIDVPIIPVLLGILLIDRFNVNLRLKLPYFKYFVLFFTVAVISRELNNVHYLQFFVFITKYWWAYFYFVVLVNETNKTRINKVFNTIKILVLSQLLAVFIKFTILGISEKGGIGTLSTTSGSLSIIFAALIITILFSIYLFQRKPKYIFLIIGFMLFAIIGEKRAIILFVPIMLIVTFIIYFIKAQTVRKITTLKYFFILNVLIVLSIYVGIKAIPSMNPDNKVWGRFDPQYTTDWFIGYTNWGQDRRQLEHRHISTLSEVRRLDGLYYFTRYLYRKADKDFYFGEGAGSLVLMHSVTGEDHSMLAQYGIRYGGRMGIIKTSLQVGLLGTLIYFGLFVKIFVDVWRKKALGPATLALLSSTVLIFFDSAIYSYSFINDNVLLGIYFSLLGYIHLKEKWPDLLWLGKKTTII